jgi:hypothetical protein
VAVRLQIPFLHVERGDGDYGEVAVGVGPIENPTGNWTQDEISRWQQCYAAGAAAEQLLFGAYRQYASRQDRDRHDVLERTWSQSRRGGWERDVQSAMKLLDRESVEKVAKELDQRQKLSEDEVYELLGYTLPWY